MFGPSFPASFDLGPPRLLRARNLSPRVTHMTTIGGTPHLSPSRFLRQRNPHTGGCVKPGAAPRGATAHFQLAM
jgi:hypothetical protein